MDPIQALQNYLMSLPAAQRTAFTQKTGFDLNNLYLMNYDAAKQFCEAYGVDLRQSDNNIWTKYNQAKADWNKHHEMYVKANAQYKVLRDARDSAKVLYNKEVTKAVNKNDGKELSASEDSAIRKRTKYTTDAIKSVSDAGIAANVLLDAMRNDVSSQSRGLQQGMLGEIFNNKG